MKIATEAEVGLKFSAFLKASKKGPVVITRNGRPVAVIVGVDDGDEMERLLMAHSPRLHAILEQSRQQYREGKWLGEEDFWSEMERTKPTKTPAKPRRKRA